MSSPLCFSTPLALRFRTTLPRNIRNPTRASASASNSSTTAPCPTRPSTAVSPTPLFQCPVCKTPYPPVPPLNLSALPPSCPSCSSPAVQRPGFVDLTPNPSSTPTLLRNLLTQHPGQSFFQLPLISFAYERGWRSAFSRAGFPGPDKELDLFLDFAAPASSVLDMSCGSGLMARRLATAPGLARVVAADYSEAMLRQTVAYARRDVTVPEFDVVRADVACLPFVNSAFDAVHCGAALHCWPNVQDGLAEIFRVLRPGGRFFATTFLKLAYVPNRKRLTQNPTLMKTAVRLEELLPVQRPYRFFDEDEVEYLFKAAGFVDVDVEALKGCVIVRSRKPEE